MKRIKEEKDTGHKRRHVSPPNDLDITAAETMLRTCPTLQKLCIGRHTGKAIASMFARSSVASSTVSSLRFSGVNKGLPAAVGSLPDAIRSSLLDVEFHSCNIKHLDGSMFGSLANCAALRDLRMTEVLFTAEDASSLSLLTQLSSLTCHNCSSKRVPRAPVAAIASLTALTSLTLSYNGFGEENWLANVPSISCLSSLSRLHHLHLSFRDANDHAEAGLAAALPEMLQLRGFTLHWCKLTDGIASALANMAHLTHLGFIGTELATPHPLVRLQSLELVGHIEYDVCSLHRLIGGVTSLHTMRPVGRGEPILRVTDARLLAPVVAALQPCNIEALGIDLADSDIDLDLLLGALKPLAGSLGRLSLMELEIDESGLGQLSECLPRLQQIELRHCDVPGLQPLHRLSRLDTLVLDTCSGLTPAALAAFCEAAPRALTVRLIDMPSHRVTLMIEEGARACCHAHV